MPNTTRGYPYPAGTDPADGPGGFQDLAEAVDTDVADVEADAAAALNAHAIDQTGVHGIADTAALYRAGGTDVAVADGGTGASTAADARANLGAAPAASPAFTGTVTIGGDVNLYRDAADVLKTDDGFEAKHADVRPAAVNDATMAFRAFAEGLEAWERYRVMATGRIEWGGGAAAPDVNLYRDGVDVLKTDDGFEAKYVDVRPAAGQIAFRSWREGVETWERLRIVDGKLELGGGAAAPDTNLYRDAADVLRTDDSFRAVNGWMLAHAGTGQKVISGRVNADGSAAVGSGFTSAKTGTGAYTVTFTTPFSGVPHVVVSGSSVLNIGTANHLAGSVNVWVVRDDNGAAIDGEFNFIAIGPA